MQKSIECKECLNSNIVDNIYCGQCGEELPKIENQESQWIIIKLSKFIWHLIKKIFMSLLNNFYIVLLVISIFYFILFAITLNDAQYFPNWIEKNYWLNFCKDISILVFSAGIFTASLKYLQYIKMFESEFDKILMSERFNNKIKQNVESITYSEDFLLQQNNLDEIWEKVTLSKYKKQFPELYPILKKNIKNELFKKNNISYYYKNFRIEYFVTKEEGDIIRIEERTKYTIIRPTSTKFKWDFSISIESDDSENGKYPEIDIRLINNECGMNFVPKDDIKSHVTEEGLLVKKVDKVLKGQKEYHVFRTTVVKQNLNNDREFKMGCSRIIDDLDVSVKYSNDLKVIFSRASNVSFIKEDLQDLNSFSYINRDLMLPGEKFKLFFLKK